MANFFEIIKNNPSLGGLFRPPAPKPFVPPPPPVRQTRAPVPMSINTFKPAPRMSVAPPPPVKPAPSVPMSRVPMSVKPAPRPVPMTSVPPPIHIPYRDLFNPNKLPFYKIENPTRIHRPQYGDDNYGDIRTLPTRMSKAPSDSFLSSIKKTGSKILSGIMSGEPYDPKGSDSELEFGKLLGTYTPATAGIGFLAGSVKTVKGAKLAAKERGFARTVRESKETAEELVDRIIKSPETQYNPITNNETLKKAKTIIDTNINEAQRLVFEGTGGLDAQTSAVGQLLIKKAQDTKDWTSAIRIVEKLSERATTSGQGIQALSMFNRLSPEGVLRYVGTLKNRAEQAGKGFKFTPKQAEDFVRRSVDLQKLPEGREKVLETAKLLRDIQELTPPSFLKKISTIQTITQLVNPKTWIRNVGGNLIFAGLENVSRLIAVGADIPLSKITGKRSVTLPSAKEQAKGFFKGGKEAAQEAWKGVDTKNLPTQFDLSGRVFKDPFFGSAEKLLNLGLKVPDRAFFQSAFDDSLLNQARVEAMNSGLKGMKLEAKVLDLLGKPTKQMVENAHLEGLYRTFQDDNVATQLFQGLKKAFNFQKEFGMGDLILKYPRTPASLLARAVEYSPYGFLGSLKQMTNPLFKKSFNQKAFVDSLARATVGTAGLTTTGYILHNAGILSVGAEKDPDLRSIQRLTGDGQYKINLSALKRFVLSGFNKDVAKKEVGDKLISYDWAQPMAVSLAMGGNISERQKQKQDKDTNVFDTFSQFATTGVDTLAAGVDTLAEQPLVQGVKRFFGGQSVTDSIVQTVLQAPASMTPTLLSQINQALDNTEREKYDPDVLQESLNYVLAKIPILAATLPPKRDVFGEEAERFQNDSNNIFNVFINPAFITEYLPSPEAKMVLDLYKATGETKQLPRVVPQKITIDGVSKTLTTEQFLQYQTAMGQATKEVFRAISEDPIWKEITDEDRVHVLQSSLTKINAKIKEKLFNIKDGKTIEPEVAPTPAPQSNLLDTFSTEAQATESEQITEPTQLIQQYFPPDQLDNAQRVMMGESSGNPNATNDNTNGSRDWGLFQINDIHAPDIKRIFGYEMEELFDPAKNVEVAAWLWKRDGGWHPWVAAQKLGIR